MLWRCWLEGRKGIQPVKNRVVGCWRGYLSGARCRLAYGPADATATQLFLASVKSRLILPFWYRLTWVVPRKGPLNGCVCPWKRSVRLRLSPSRCVARVCWSGPVIGWRLPRSNSMQITDGCGVGQLLCFRRMQAITAGTVIAYITHDDRSNISSASSRHAAKRRGGLNSLTVTYNHDLELTKMIYWARADTRTLDADDEMSVRVRACRHLARRRH